MHFFWEPFIVLSSSVFRTLNETDLTKGADDHAGKIAEKKFIFFSSAFAWFAGFCFSA